MEPWIFQVEIGHVAETSASPFKTLLNHYVIDARAVLPEEDETSGAAEERKNPWKKRAVTRWKTSS